MTVNKNNISHVCQFFVVSLSDAKPLLGLKSCKLLDILNINDVEIDKTNILKQYSDLFTGLGLVKESYHSCKKRSSSYSCTKESANDYPTKAQKHTLLPGKSYSYLKNFKADTLGTLNGHCRKKDGSLRLCIDPKELNKSVLRQYKTTPSTEKISSKLCGNKVFTVIDMADCYWHIKLDKPSSELCMFNTPYGRYKFNRMPFGISCASDAAQEMNELNFGDIPNVLAIHDDLIIAAKTNAEHDKLFKQILQ